MRDPMTFERRLDDAYDRWASEMRTDVDGLELVRATRGRRVPARQLWSWRSLRTLVVLALLTGLAIAAGLWLAGRITDDARPEVGYRAIVSRISDESRQVVSVRADGQERVILALSPVLDARGEAREETWDLSSTGWLATDAGQGWQFIDLHESSRAPTTAPAFPGVARGHSWAPDGRFAEWDEQGHMRLLDPATGSSEDKALRPPVYDIDAWTADGNTLQGGDHVPIYSDGLLVVPEWRVVRLDGGPDDTVIPDLYRGLNMPMGAGGARIQLCDLQDQPGCPGLPSGAVIGQDPDGKVSTWYLDELAPDRVLDAVFGGDGTGMWLLLDRRVGGRQVALGRLDVPGEPTVVATSGLPDDGFAHGIIGVAPDDSLVMIAASGPLLIEPLTGRSLPIDGGFLGFVASAEVDTWAGEAFHAVEPVISLAPRFPASPTLRPIETLIAEQVSPGDHVLWQHEQVAAEEGAGGPRSTVESGPIELTQGLGVLLTCSGPSDVVITTDIPLDDFTRILSHCRQDGDTDVAGGSAGWRQIDATVRFTVESTPDTSWQVVVFDPAQE